jgi:hypothetical protein
MDRGQRTLDRVKIIIDELDAILDCGNCIYMGHSSAKSRANSNKPREVGVYVEGNFVGCVASGGFKTHELKLKPRGERVRSVLYRTALQENFYLHSREGFLKRSCN